MRVVSLVHLYEHGNHYVPGDAIPGLSLSRARHLEALGLVRIEGEEPPATDVESVGASQDDPGQGSQKAESEADFEPQQEEAGEEPEPAVQVAAPDEPPRHRAMQRRQNGRRNHGRRAGR